MIFDIRHVVVAGDELHSLLPVVLVHEGVNVSEARGEELHHAALGRLPEEPRQVETSGLEDEDEDHPLVVLVVSPAKTLTTDVILPEARVGVVHSLGPIELVIDAVSAVDPAVDVHHISTHTGIVPYKNFTMRIAQYLSDIQLMGLPIRLEVT